jgi:hypothetical protein
MHGLELSLRHFWDRPYMAIALIITLLGILDLIYALASAHTKRHRFLRVFFWMLYPLLLITFSTGRKSRQDRDTHIIYAGLVLLAGLLLVIAALLF